MDAERFVQLEDPLYQSDLRLEPDMQSRLHLGDVIRWTFAVITGRFGGQQMVVPANSSGHLKVVDDGAVSKLTDLISDLASDPHFQITGDDGNYEAKVTAGGSMQVQVAYGASLAKVEQTYLAEAADFGLIVGNFYLVELYAILNDVYDATNHYLKVHETA